jgi:hypothetical protein
MKKLLLLPLIVISLNAADISTLFSKGQKNFGFGLGSSSGFGENYTVVSASLNYFIQDNLSVGAGYQGWFGADPKINEISIPVTYYYPLNAQYHPYIGGIYRHTFIGDSDIYDTEDYDVFGGRIGVAMTMGRNTYMQIGWVQEYRTHGDDSQDEGYPEISMGFVF